MKVDDDEFEELKLIIYDFIGKIKLFENEKVIPYEDRLEFDMLIKSVNEMSGVEKSDLIDSFEKYYKLRLLKQDFYYLGWSSFTVSIFWLLVWASIFYFSLFKVILIISLMVTIVLFLIGLRLNQVIDDYKFEIEKHAKKIVSKL
ncbi:MAG: hypothetical protein BWY78_01092 [Alphaproteobacteria bacterium ADurb.Bin438]|nr:MAG: hypothetical protein BWY78_01092 [Alphaproteobacteria bacterium ADurb.Bin438]